MSSFVRTYTVALAGYVNKHLYFIKEKKTTQGQEAA